MKQKGRKTKQRGRERWAGLLLSLPLTATAQSILDTPATQVAAGVGFSCALTTSGGVNCWGGRSRPTPVPVVDAGAVPLATVVSIVTGQGHSCALIQAGGVKCWGNNQYGQLGNNAAGYYSSTPVSVVDDGNTPIGNVTQLGAGYYGNCALTSAGGVECWGSNSYGQLGNNSMYASPFSPRPVLVDGLASGVLRVSVGAFHACAVTIAGNVACWGNDSDGQLGNHASGGISRTPVAVVDANNRKIGGIVAVSAGSISSCALTTAGTVQCWGYSYGDTSVTVSGVFNIVALSDGCGVTAAGGVKCWGGANHTPTDIVGLTSGIAAISNGATHTCALTSGGGVLCLGDDADGELGDGISSATPAPVSGLGAGVKAVSGTARYTCAISATDAAMCWGDNTEGLLGNGSMSNIPSFVPVQVQTLTSGVTAISSSKGHSCAVVNGGVKCWGNNGRGELGNNSTNYSLTPVTVVDGSNAPLGGMSAVSSGTSHTCALTNIGGVRCWGANFFGQLGNNNLLNDSAVAVTVVDAGNVPLSGVMQIAAGEDHTCALLSAGGVKCWGTGGLGQLGNNSFSSSPVATAVVDGNNIPITGVAGIAAGWEHTCAFTAAGAAKCWGNNEAGQLGDNTYGTNRKTPVSVLGLTTGVTAIAGGEDHTCASTSDGVRCWGTNNEGELGNPSVSSLLPVAVVDASNIPISSLSAISAGGLHTCGINASGAQCWGWNRFGQLGRSISRTTPVPVWGSSAGVEQLALGKFHTCARTSSGGISCWGANDVGQLGSAADGTSNIPIPAQDSSGQPLGGFVEIATGALHTCARSPSGAVICWGSDGSGQLGNHSAGGSSTVPVRVVDSGDAPLANAAGLAAGAAHTCAVNASGGVMCWGYNAYGQLGNNNRPNDSNVAVAVATSSANNSPISGIASVAAGADHTCALTAGHGVKCWGDNEFGQLGNNSGGTPGSVSTAPVDVSGLTSGVAAVVAGDFFSCAVTTSQGAKCWGYNGDGQLGTNDTQKRLLPTDVSGLTSGVAAVVAGANHACALTTSGGLKCWGDNGSGQLGDGSTAQRNLPVNVSGLGSGVVAIAAGGDHTCALTTQGLLRCWGADASGQVGNNSSTSPPVAPVPVPVDILKGQSIAFTPARSMGLGTLNLSATASSGLGVVFDTWTPATCQVNGTKLTASSYGLCGVRASQAGGANGQNGTVATAPQQLRIISISNEIFGNGFE